MAHHCPDCNQVCYCCEDIDDSVLDIGKEMLDCEHFKTDGCGVHDDIWEEQPSPRRAGESAGEE